GSYTVTVSLSEDNTSTTVTDTQQVTEPAIVGSSATLGAVAEGDAAAAVEVATFTDRKSVVQGTDVTAAVDRGIDGNTADAAPAAGMRTTYVARAPRSALTDYGSYTVTVSLSEDNTSTTVTDTQQVTEPAIVGSSATLGAVAEGDAAAAVEVATF